MQFSQQDIFILAIRRSGNHAIANWLIPHFPGMSRYLNDYVFLPQTHPAGDPLQGNPTYLYLTYAGQTYGIMNKAQAWTIQEIVARETANLLKKKWHPLLQRFFPPDTFERMINELSIEHVTLKFPYWTSNDAHI